MTVKCEDRIIESSKNEPANVKDSLDSVVAFSEISRQLQSSIRSGNGYQAVEDVGIGNRILQCDTTPFGKNPNSDDILSLYEDMYESLQIAKKDRKYLIKWVSAALPIVEVNAEQNVLRAYFDMEHVLRMNKEERRNTFLQKLYQNRGQFVFFEARKKVVSELVSLNIVKVEDYCR